MPLPINDITPWPPAWAQRQYRHYREWSAWYAADAMRLTSYYGGHISRSIKPPLWRFWERAGRERIDLQQDRYVLHVPLASDIAATSGRLMVGEFPKVTIPEAHGETPNERAVQAEARLLEMLERSGAHQTLGHAAETCAAMGGVFLKVDWDKELLDTPFITAVQVDCVLPEFRHGRLRAATLWRVLEFDKETVWRHVERHEPGLIEHGLYKGTSDNLGKRLPLDSRHETRDLPDSITLPFDGLAIVYIPNQLPNRHDRASALGRPDIDGAEGLLDALDETWTSWMRDIRLAKARLIVPAEYLQPGRWPDGPLTTLQHTFGFDIDQEIFSPLEMDSPDATPMLIQPGIRVDEHMRSVRAQTETIIRYAGYSPQSFGITANEGPAESGKALKLRERRSLETQQGKRKYWEPQLAPLFQRMLAIDAAEFGGGTPTEFRPVVQMADGLPEHPDELASTVTLMHQAQAASVETRVRYLHPEWSETEVAAEVERVMAELGLAVPNPLETGIV